MTAPASEKEPSPPLSKGERNGTICFLGLVAAIAAILIVAAMSFPETPLPTDVGPARFPHLFAFILIALCAVQCYLTLKTPVVRSLLDTPSADRPNYMRVAIGVVLTSVCIYVMPYFGFMVSAAVYLFALMWLMGRAQLIWNAFFAILLTSLIYLVFSYGLNVPLPEMIWLEY